MKKLTLLLTVLMLVNLLSACGQTGRLYLPHKTKQADTVND